MVSFVEGLYISNSQLNDDSSISIVSIRRIP